MSNEIENTKNNAGSIVQTIDSVSFNLPTVSKNIINQVAVKKVSEGLPELEEKTRAFDRSNSQTTLSMMSLTMLTGQSPMRMMRQIMAETEKRKMALAEAQVSHAEKLEEIHKLEIDLDQNPDNHLLQSKLRLAVVNIRTLESKINGSFKDIATLIDSYESLKSKHQIDEWDEEAFEREEKHHHVRRGFELMYRNLIDGGRAATSTIEYLQQYGVHPQVALTEVSGYIKHTADRIAQKILPHANDLEDFLDEMANKYYKNADATSERIYGRTQQYNTEYMNLLQQKD